MHLHHLAVHLILFGTPALLLQPLPLLLRLSHAALPLGEHDHGEDAPLLLEPHQLLVEVVEGLADLAADGAGDVPCDELVLVLLQRRPVPLLRVVLQRLHRAQLLDEFETLGLGLEHVVLDCPPAQQPLDQDHPQTLLVVLRHRRPQLRRRRPYHHWCLAVLSEIIVLVDARWQMLLLDRRRHPIEVGLHLAGLASIGGGGKLGDARALDAHCRHALRQTLFQLHHLLVRHVLEEGRLVLGRILVHPQPLTLDRRVRLGGVVGILGDDITLEAARLAHDLPRLGDLPQLPHSIMVHLGSIRLHGRSRSIFELLHPLLIHESRFPVSRLESFLDHLEPLLLQRLDFCLSSRHFLHLLHLHHRFPCLCIIRYVWKRRFKRSSFPRTFNHFNLGHPCWQATPPHELAELQQLGLAFTLLNTSDVRSERVRLGLALSVVRLCCHGLGERLGL
mmetsp:Transcript_5103/g.10231  ORF Transcript_5103/g.10231 Transcript_5103/m.10231 type:complete len:448 (-) Transcript_5103:367-1710(-)